MNGNINQYLEILKMIMPWVTGGLAGAILTYLLNRRLAKKSQKRLLVKTTLINYSLPSHNEAFKSLKVWYAGTNYDELVYFEFSVKNISQKVVASAPFILSLPKECSIIDKTTESTPVPISIDLDEKTLGSNMIQCTFGEMHFADTGKVGLLLSGITPVEWHFRGNDDVEIESEDLPSTISTERDLRDAILWIATYVFAGAVPFFSSMIQGILIFISVPFWVRTISRWRVRQSHVTSSVLGPIIVSDSGRLSIDFDPRTGASSVAASFDNDRKVEGQNRLKADELSDEPINKPTDR